MNTFAMIVLIAHVFIYIDVTLTYKHTIVKLILKIDSFKLKCLVAI